MQNKGNVSSFLGVINGQLTRENSAALNEFRTEVSEANAKLARLEEKLRDLGTENAETTGYIEAAQKKLHILENSTQSEALRLKGMPFEAVFPATFYHCRRVEELASLEALHLWHTSRVQADLFEFIYASRFHVYIPCVEYKPLKDQIRITKTKDKRHGLKDQFPRFTDFTIQVAHQQFASFSGLGVKQVRFALSHALQSCIL